MAGWDINDRPALTATFRNPSDALADPTEVTIRYTDPSGNTAEEIYNGGAGTVARDSLGIFSFAFTLDEAGRWEWSAQGTGVIVASQEAIFYVRDRNVPDV